MARLILCVAVVMVAVVSTVAEGSGEKARRQEKLLERLLRYEKENSHVKKWNVAERVDFVFKRVFGEGPVNTDVTLKGDMDLTDWDTGNLMRGLEDEFELEISGKAQNSFDKVQDIINYVSKNTKKDQ